MRKFDLKILGVGGFFLSGPDEVEIVLDGWVFTEKTSPYSGYEHASLGLNVNAARALRDALTRAIIMAEFATSDGEKK